MRAYRYLPGRPDGWGRNPVNVLLAAAVVAGVVSAPVPAAAAPAEEVAEDAARDAVQQQATRPGDLGDDAAPPELGSLADLSDPLPDDELVAALKEAARTGRPVELASQTTETSISFAQPDGTVEVESAAGPVRTQVDGEWIDVDVTLELTDAGVRPAAVTGDITFSAGGEQPMAVLGDGEDTSLTLQWPAELPQPELEANTATYRDVLPDVDLVLTATRLGFEQHLVVNERPDAATVDALSSLEFPTTAEGAAIAEGAGGELQVVDEAGAVVGTAAAPLMWDARTDRRSDQPAAVEEIGLDLATPTEPGTDATLVLTPPTDFLTDPATVYPVVIDPTQALGALGDTFVQSNIANTAQGGSTELRVGSYDTGANRARSLLRFDVGPVKNRIVQSATLSLFENYAYSCSPRWVDIRDAGNFDPNTVTWNSQPAIGGIVANANVAHGYSTSCPDNWVNFNLTGWVAHYADTRNGRGNTMPLAVQAGSETDSWAWKKFNSGNAAGNVPKLTFTYDGWCDQYNGLSVCGAIRDKWHSLGGPGGVLGLPTTGDAATPGGGGWFNHFQHGSIYYSNATGAHTIRGAIRDKWNALGGVTSYLGFPSTDDTWTNNAGGGAYNHFAGGGSIYWSANTGAHHVRGAIRDKWAALGWERSYLGFPTTDDTWTNNGGGGAYNHFTGGSIYWSQATGAHPIRGAIRDRWAALGWENSYLGFPARDEYPIASGARQDFQRGQITLDSVSGFTQWNAAPTSTNPNPIRWDIYTTFLHDGRDVPLRYGQHDAGPIDGFGTRHIEDGGHLPPGGWDEMVNMIDQVLENVDIDDCVTSGSTVTCNYGVTYVTRVVYSTRVDPASGDGRPVGIITAFQYCNFC